MFTSTTFRASAFADFDLADHDATHLTWLNRCWAREHDQGIRTSAVDYVGLHRRIHPENSWTQHPREAHADLLAELREITRRRRE